MEITASQLDVRQAPRKVRLVANTVKAMSLEAAIRQLAVVPRAATLPVLKTLRQAVANATHNHGLAAANLRIKEIIVNDGATLKRWRAVSRGRAHSIQKKTCHVMVTLETIETTAVSAAQDTKKVQPAKKAVSAAKTQPTEKSKPVVATAAAKPARRATATSTAKVTTKKAAK